jgi:hypothetical protein
MCCGSKRSAWRSAPASTPQPRAAPIPVSAAPIPVSAAPIPVSAAPTPVPPKPPVDAREAAVFAPSPKFRLSALQQEAPSARPARIWRLTS